jgi:hypothetical protein
MELEVVERGPRERELALGEARPDPSGEESRPGAAPGASRSVNLGFGQ